ncbi:exonuclease SbcCD subunit D [Clostridium rectalis]|uniref:exonuclease SbcCD subunit D n=1 Tax=Clostridium rectalis TaxID=2040295 RepID=UPI000F639FB3|nr:exonuclease SbcCD subunit D [Clostridium rectalis]
MRILHTSDWHLGKSLEGVSRLDEQELFLKDFKKIVEKYNIDMVIISGDIYDSGNPPARAERMFYRIIKDISDNGKRIILIISGNHDSPNRLVAASPIAKEHGIVMVDLPKTVVKKGQYGDAFINDSGEGYIEIELRGEKAVIIVLPYPSEKRLNEVLSYDLNEEAKRRSYSDRVGEIFEKLSLKYRDDTINIAVSHIFICGSDSSDSERPIELGGSLAVDVDKLPKRAQYIALGHLHKPQKVRGTSLNAYYSGSPLQYSKSEINYAKCCYVLDIKAGQDPRIESIMFHNYKPIEIWKCNGIDDAIKKCEENREKNSWVYLEIRTDSFISQEDIKTMRNLKKDILEIKPIILGEEEIIESENIKDKSMEQLFESFYKFQRGVEPEEEVKKLFLEICHGEGEEKDET